MSALPTLSESERVLIAYVAARPGLSLGYLTKARARQSLLEKCIIVPVKNTSGNRRVPVGFKLTVIGREIARSLGIAMT